jgi:hypothetical protein
MINNNINILYCDKKFPSTSAKSPAPARKEARDASATPARHQRDTSATPARRQREKSAKNRRLKFFYMEYQQIS